MLSGAAFTFDQENIYSTALHVDDDNKKNVLAAAGVFPHLQSSSSQGRAAALSLSLSLSRSLCSINYLFPVMSWRKKQITSKAQSAEYNELPFPPSMFDC